MYDLDETYLLQSYNQNQPLFANMSKQPVYNKTSGQVKKITRSRYDSCKLLKINNNKNVNVDEHIVLNVRMMDSICEDELENQRTASKISREKLKSISVSGNQHGKYDTVAAYNKKNLFSEINRLQNRDLQKNNASLKLKFLLQPQHQPQTDLQDEQIFENLINDSYSTFLRNYKTLQQILLQNFRKYSILASKIEQYETLITNYEQLIQKQQQCIRIWADQFQHLSTKLSTSFCMQNLNRPQNSKNMMKDYFTLAQMQIIEIIHDKTKHINIKNITPMTQVSNKIIINSIKCTKSVPIFHEQPDTSCQSPKMRFKQANTNNISVSQYNSAESASQQPIVDMSKDIKQRKQSIIDVINQNVQEFKTARFVTASHNTEQTNIKIKQDQSQTGDTFRRIANFRIKQLETQNTLMKNQVQSSNAKIMVIKIENKQLKEIVEGLIAEIHRLNAQYQSIKNTR